jgi:cell division protein FtsQ
MGITACLTFFTDTFSIEKVVINGNEMLPSEHLRQVSGIDSYDNLVTLPVGRIERNTENNSWIKDARISRKLLHTVRIEVEERKPVALLDFGGSAFVMDSSGYTISKVEPGQFEELPRLFAGDCSVPKVDTNVRNKVLRRSIEMLSGMPESIREDIALVNPFDGRGHVMVSRSGYTIVYGEASECRHKDQVLEAIVIEIRSNGRNVAYIDVRVPDSPVVMLQ